MGLPHFTLDVRDRFAASVVDDFVAEHAAGRTPNPCVRCNGLVRFDAMLALAERVGAARLATGHYARIDADSEGPLVRSATDARKDQAYMLARLRPGELERLWFPLGELEKPQVRGIARAAQPRAALGADGIDVRDAFLHRPGKRVDRVKLRYRSAPVRCRIEGEPGAGAHDRLRLVLEEPVHGVAPGQTACVMERDRVIGWATIAGTFGHEKR